MSIHIVADRFGVAIWSDCGPNEQQSGRCIGMGDTVEEACRAALLELREDLDALERLALVVRTGAVETPR